MKVWVINAEGGIDGLQMIDRDIPKPGPGEILVRLKANSINYRDLSTIKNAAARGIAGERIPNSDGAGIVEDVGPGGTAFKKSDRVVGTFFQDWLSGSIHEGVMASALGGPIDGLLCEYALLEERGALHMPDHLSFEEAATLPCAGLTAWHCLIEGGGARAGQTVLLLGTGGVSIFAQQIAKASGIRTILTSSSDEKLDRAKALGADVLINYRDCPNWEEKVMEATDGRGVDLVVEVGGAGTLEKSIASVRVGGRISLVGILTGGQMDPTSIMRKSITLQGIYVGPRDMFERFNAALLQNDIHPVIDASVEFADAKEAYRMMEKAGHFGKIVVTI
ncbi:NAD(P)-dependent alcohol dehydrogenase [Sneathiella sp.]|uniref:zinc-dependent alcohol dehydrogenase family protein n=1 Tax=Sneathiella sp. TaxID=1964365 RepID=UPI0026058B83|nr:NAD(P)-dependent alcohol dehydrogenase [Sneathiella sp.]MDF2366092.1 NAD(P)-dependent alcohol dehydrogenase [Sneathiella sp.]